MQGARGGPQGARGWGVSKANETLARRWMASKHWGGWRAGMKSRCGRLFVEGRDEGEAFWVWCADDGCESLPIEIMAPDLDHPGTRAFFLEDVRHALGFLVSCPFSDDGGRTWHLWRGRHCFSGDTEAAALIAALEAAP